jgi:hypothetical protein
MNSPTPHAIALQASWDLPSPGQGRLQWLLTNRSAGALYVLDRLWTTAPGARAAVSDSERAYRLVDGGVLVFLLGPAPQPEKLIPLRNVPYSTYLAPGAELRRDWHFTLPLREYNVYYTVGRYERAAVARIRVEVWALMVEEGMETVASSFDPSALFLNVPDVVERAFVLQSPEQAVELEIERAAGDFARSAA